MPPLECFPAGAEMRVYRFPVRAFPGLEAMIHVVRAADQLILVDAGSGLEESNSDLLDGLQAISREYREPPLPESLSAIVLTHGHIDHFGGMAWLRGRCAAPLAAHELDMRVLTSYEERLAWTAARLRGFLQEAGVAKESLGSMMDLYSFAKSLSRSVAVDQVLEGKHARIGALEVTHLPGHCPGLVVIRVGSILLSSDMVLPQISPHQSPEQLMPFTGLSHYLESLAELRTLYPEVTLALGGHEGPITDLRGRVEQIFQLHADRLARLLDLLEEPRTIAEVSQRLFGAVHGYDVLLALEEAGAHIEYLEQRGFLEVMEAASRASGGDQPLHYRRVAGRSWQGLRSYGVRERLGARGEEGRA
ncbi:MAG: MBL fold metallo-hydrolase [Anaerolineales bacterium]|jgi:glyoxylase-like metal-dependent hydrolase (beta-lactamase superfamily II)